MVRTTPRPGPPDPPPSAALLPGRVAARVLVVQAVLALVVGLTFLACYAGLQRAPRPHHLPVAVVGQALASAVTAGAGTTTDVTLVADDAAARRTVVAHDRVAALSVQADGSTNLYVAGPDGLAENAAAEGVARAVTRQSGSAPRVVDLVPLLPFDPRGLASFYVALAVTVASFILAQAMFALRQLVGLRAQLLTLVGFAVGVGSVTATVAGPVLRVVPVGFVSLVAVLALLSVAVSFGSRALTAWLGPFGITIATLTMTAVGLSTSGGILGEHLLPRPLGTLGALLPPGAALRALVSVGYFSGRHAAVPLLVLAGWAALGLGALLVHRRRPAVSDPGPRPTAATAGPQSPGPAPTA